MHLLICTTGMNFDTIKVLDRFQTPGKGISQRGLLRLIHPQQTS